MHARTALILAAFTAALALPGAATAATTIGSDLTATPSAGCSDLSVTIKAVNDCTATQLDGGTYAVPSSGVITRWSLRHGPELGVSIPTAQLRILTPAGDAQTFGARIVGGLASLSGAAATDTFTFTDDYGRANGVPVTAGERIAVYVDDAALPVFAADAGHVGMTLGSHGSGTRSYESAAGTLLLQAIIEPDADSDGYGDETQDACPTVAGPGACPGATPTPTPTPTPAPGPSNPGGGTIPFFVAPTIEAFHAEEIAVYHAATIQRLPATVNLYDAVMRGFSQPIQCALACRITTAATMRGISASLYAMMSRTRTLTVGRSSGAFPTAGRGRLRVKLTAKARRALRRYHRSVKITLRTKVTDGRKAVVRTQTITLKVKKRR